VSTDIVTSPSLQSQNINISTNPLANCPLAFNTAILFSSPAPLDVLTKAAHVGTFVASPAVIKLTKLFNESLTTFPVALKNVTIFSAIELDGQTTSQVPAPQPNGTQLYSRFPPVSESPSTTFLLLWSWLVLLSVILVMSVDATTIVAILSCVSVSTEATHFKVSSA